MRRCGAVVAVLSVVAAALAASPVEAQEPAPATVTRVINGDTLEAQLESGEVIMIRLIGIDAPEVATECGADQATESLRELLPVDEQVELVGDPTQNAVDRHERTLAYVDRADDVDAGEAQVRRGWADVYVFERNFQRLPFYLDSAAAAEDDRRGVWRFCGGRFDTRRDSERPDDGDRRHASAAAFMRRYYRRISNAQYATAWGMLASKVRRTLGTFSQWKAGHRRTIRVSVVEAQTRLSRGRAVVSIAIRSRDRDICNGRVVRQVFRGRWLLGRRGSSWVALRVKMRKTAGGRVRLSRSECAPPPSPTPPPPPTPSPPPPTPSPPPPTPSPPPQQDCQGYSPCIPPGGDVDCAGGSGNGPRYRPGPIYVTGSDPYDLDSDGDGVACES